MEEQIKIFAGEASRGIAESIARSYGVELGKVIVSKFSDGEFQPSYEETVRGKDVFIVQSTMPPTENLFELLLLIDGARRASAKSVNAVIPYFGWARQDRKDRPRVSIGAKMVANLLTAAGVDRIMTMDLHADQIQGFFEVPVDHIYGSTIFIPYIQSLGIDNLTIAAPDTGGTKRANAYAKYFDADLAICYKQRSRANHIASMTVIGEVKDRNVVLVDDMCDTAGTLTKAAEMMMEHGAKSVRAICTHAVLSGPAFERIENSALTELIVLDTIPLSQKCDKITVLSVADLFAKVIRNVQDHSSISTHFIC